MLEAVIFDFDQTIADTSGLEEYRRQGQWNEVYRNFDKIKKYENISEVFNALKSKGIKIGVVTNSPSQYCTKAFEYLGLHYDNIVGYHDTRLKKPFADPVLYSLQKLEVKNKNKTLGFGDHINDIISYKRANIVPIACMWGATNNFNPNCLKIFNPYEILELIF